MNLSVQLMRQNPTSKHCNVYHLYRIENNTTCPAVKHYQYKVVVVTLLTFFGDTVLYQPDTFLVTPCTDGWYKTVLTREGVCMCSLLRAKGFTWIPPVRHILVLVPRFDREFLVTFQQHGHGKTGTQFKFNFVFNEDLRLNK